MRGQFKPSFDNFSRWRHRHLLNNEKSFRQLVFGEVLSLQMHHHRSEHWVVVAGTARVTCGENLTDVHVNESTYIPMSTRHRLENPGKVPLHVIEVQNGDYLGEDDIVRFEDVYDRA